MKIYKKDDHSLIVKSFGIMDKIYLATTVLIYFDLAFPEEPLKEQELWQTIPGLLGETPILDMGMPKPRAEVLVTGKCFAPRGSTLPSSRVSIRVGGVSKALYIFGNRYWKGPAGTRLDISAPEPFSEIPLTWENAFGGKGFDKNHVGKGIGPVVDAKGDLLYPLPNIEDPGRLIGSPSDRPDPAGLGPLDLMRPQRQKKAGTYGKKWQRERWPHFPEDMNYELFNMAPEDQFLPGFFTGDEAIEVANMHPDLPVIRSKLPPVRIRCFVTRKKDLKDTRLEDAIFQEIETRIDTLWLFPEILRGVVMYRGTCEISDDEFADIIRIYVASEKRDETPKTIEHYREEQRKAADLSVPIDMAPFQAAGKRIAGALKRFRSMPKELAEIKKRALGQAPVMPYTPSEMKTQKEMMIADGKAVIDRLETMARDMHGRWGHLVRIDLGIFDRFRSNLKSASGRIDGAVEKLEAARKKGDELKKSLPQAVKEKVAPEYLKKAGIDPEQILAKKAVNPFHDRGFPLVVQWRKNLEFDREARKIVLDLGLEDRMTRKYWLGLNPEARIEDRKDEGWGMKDEGRIQDRDESGHAVSFSVPTGLVIPGFDGPVLSRIRIKTGDFAGPDPYVLVEGSKDASLFIPGVEEKSPVVRVAGELEAILVDQEVGDVCGVVALAGPECPLGENAGKAVEEAEIHLVVLPEKPMGPQDELSGWLKLFPKAKAIVMRDSCRTLFEMQKKGHDIRAFIMEALPPDIQKKNRIEPVLPEPGKPPTVSPLEGLAIPSFDVKGMVEKLDAEIRQALQPKFDSLLAKREEITSKAREALTRAGLDPEKFLNPPEPHPRKSYAELGDEIASRIGDEKKKLCKAGILTPDAEKNIDDAKALAVKIGHDSEKQYQEGMARLSEGKKEIAEAKAKIAAMELPKEAKEKLKAAGLDPDRMKKRSREEVIEMHGRGESLAGAILDGVDLSELDLSGIDLTKARCRKTKFCKSRLFGARLYQTMAQEADFTEACLQKASVEMSLFSGACFQKADLTGAEIKMATLQKADFAEADCGAARFHMTVFQQACLKEARFIGTELNMCALQEVDASQADLTRGHLFKCLFRKAVLDGANFSEAVLDTCMFNESGGSGIKFTGARIIKGGTGEGTLFPGADFRSCRIEGCCMRQADLSGASFRGGELDSALLEGCDLRKADFYRVPARQTRFTKSDLEGADLRGINLFGGSLRKSRIVDADLGGANLFGVDFYKAVFGNTRLDGANLKMSQLYGRTEYLR